MKENLFQARMNSGEPVYFGVEKDDPWIDVYARKRKKGDVTGAYTGGFARYGFNVDRDGWSYGSGPAGAREIREIIPGVLKKVTEGPAAG